MRSKPAQLLFALALGVLAAPGALAQCPASVPVQGAPPPGPLPLFPPDNWWNLNISSAPVDTNSQNFIDFINNGGTPHLHPEFGPTDGTTNGIYGIPYSAVHVAQSQVPVLFVAYSDERDYLC